MKNQVAQLEAENVQVAMLNSTVSSEERKEIYQDLQCGHPHYRLLYVTPEYCMAESFRAALQIVYKQKELARIAIDEAHCISEWGHDFRSSFLHLKYLRETFPETPIMCLTATATVQVREDIIQILQLDPKRLKVFATTVSRPNLHYEVRFTCDEDDIRFDYVVSWLKQIYTRRNTDPVRKLELETKKERPTAVSGIIYTSYRAGCDELATRLKNTGIGAVPYHAGLSTEERIQCQSKWISNEVGYDIIVATTAFGMGINKEDVRFVIHWNLPKTIEGYYQEAGRAGRDGKASVCLLFYSREDYRRLLSRSTFSDGKRQEQAKQIAMRTNSLKALIDYCESTSKCRHQMLMQYFGESNVQGCCDFACDFCKDPLALRKRKEQGLATEEYVSSQQWYAEGYED
jgi:RecQ family ATP-dependent DNA helicase